MKVRVGKTRVATVHVWRVIVAASLGALVGWLVWGRAEPLLEPGTEARSRQERLAPPSPGRFAMEARQDLEPGWTPEYSGPLLELGASERSPSTAAEDRALREAGERPPDPQAPADRAPDLGPAGAPVWVRLFLDVGASDRAHQVLRELRGHLVLDRLAAAWPPWLELAAGGELLPLLALPGDPRAVDGETCRWVGAREGLSIELTPTRGDPFWEGQEGSFTADVDGEVVTGRYATSAG